MNDATQPSPYVELAADIVSAYVSNNMVAVQDLPALIHDVHNALLRITSGPVEVSGGSRNALAFGLLRLDRLPLS